MYFKNIFAVTLSKYILRCPLNPFGCHLWYVGYVIGSRFMASAIARKSVFLRVQYCLPCSAGAVDMV